MEAHALTARMHDKTIEFPFLVLLISGGHCLLAVAQDVDKFLLLGTTLDDAPGEAFDKIARRMKLTNLPEFSKRSGGQAIELAASKAKDPLQFKLSIPLIQYKDCNFSLAGLKTQVKKCIIQEEEKQGNFILIFELINVLIKAYLGVPPDGLIPDVFNLCAGFQLVVTRHLCQRVQRAMLYVSRKNIIPEDRQTLVISDFLK